MREKDFRNYLAHKALLYAALGDTKRSEALRRILMLKREKPTEKKLSQKQIPLVGNLKV